LQPEEETSSGSMNPAATMATTERSGFMVLFLA
jgi:hypothetical protein